MSEEIKTNEEPVEVIQDEPKKNPMPKKLFDVLRIIQLTLLGLATLYITLGDLWGLPAKEAVSGSLTAIATFLGIYLKIDTSVFEQQIFGSK